MIPIILNTTTNKAVCGRRIVKYLHQKKYYYVHVITKYLDIYVSMYNRQKLIYRMLYKEFPVSITSD